jgi:hypothetical protein
MPQLPGSEALRSLWPIFRGQMEVELVHQKKWEKLKMVVLIWFI